MLFPIEEWPFPLGSIYYDLNLKEMAILQWEKALELDPGNLKLQKFLEKL
jgi:hypothetical protein